MKVVALLFLAHIFWLIPSCSAGEDTPPAVEPLHVYFTTENPYVKTGNQITFINQSLHADSFYWNFGDGATSTDENPVHTYQVSGSYVVQLIAANDTETDTCKTRITVKDHEITVMSYNIAFSGGAVEFLYDMWESDGHGSWNRDRRSELAKIINTIDPDILGIQEAFCWDSYDPKVYVSFAELIGMAHYYYPESMEAEWNGLCIYSKFPIHPKKKIFHQPCVPDQEWNGLCLLGAEVELDSSTALDFFSCHLMFHVEGAQTCEMEAIHDYLIKDLNPLTILLGDMNWAADKYYSGLMRDAGLSYVDPGKRKESNPMNIDQVWVSEDLYPGTSSFDRSNLSEVFDRKTESMLADASDHFPVVARVLY